MYLNKEQQKAKFKEIKAHLKELDKKQVVISREYRRERFKKKQL